MNPFGYKILSDGNKFLVRKFSLFNLSTKTFYNLKAHKTYTKNYRDQEWGYFLIPLKTITEKSCAYDDCTVDTIEEAKTLIKMIKAFESSSFPTWKKVK